jgi:predicted nucleotidyltransferase
MRKNEVRQLDEFSLSMEAFCYQEELPMHAMLETHKAEFVALCNQHSVVKLEAFGSIRHGTFDGDRSDLDLIATFADTGPGYSTRYLDFVESIEKLVGRHVDLLTPGAIKSPIFRQFVDACRQVNYERKSQEEAA